MKTIKILNEQVKLINPDKEISDKIDLIVKEFCGKLVSKLRKAKIAAEVFVGGSLAKKTLIKKNKYDADIFVRFSLKYKKKDLSKLLKKVLFRDAKKIHGSRDYYQIVKQDIIIEIVPVLKIKKPEQVGNITDLSYFHVNHVVGKIKKNKKLSNEIKLAKSFAYACNCYGAESYIMGFSGYALELLVCYYGSFLKFIKEISKSNLKDKVVIDEKKFYKNKKQLLEELNKSKTKSPIILIDPTFKQRNALAGLSNESFFRFQNYCKGFLKNPSPKFFEKKNVSDEFKNKKNIKIVSLKTTRQAGDIAGTKSKKFFDFFKLILKKEFIVKKVGFDYKESDNRAYLYFDLDKKKDEVIKGPHITKVENLAKFKKVHKNAFIKNHFACAKIKHDLSFDKWFKMFKTKYKKIIKEMSVKKLEVY